MYDETKSMAAQARAERHEKIMAKKKPKRTRVPINKIKAGPVRGELDEGDAIAVRYVHHYASELTAKSLEQTELDFMREADPSQEIVLWLTMIGIARRYCEVHPSADYKAALTSML